MDRFIACFLGAADTQHLKRCALTLSHISLQDKIAFLFK